MIVHKALPQDKEAWLRMRCELWPSVVDDHAAAIEQYFDGAAKFIDQAYVCQTESNVTIGFVELRIRNYAEGSEETAVPYVEGWYVDPAFRHQGAGRLLIIQAENWAIELGYTELASDAEITNERSIDAHVKLGFQEVERAVSFIKKL